MANVAEPFALALGWEWRVHVALPAAVKIIAPFLDSSGRDGNLRSLLLLLVDIGHPSSDDGGGGSRLAVSVEIRYSRDFGRHLEVDGIDSLVDDGTKRGEVHYKEGGEKR